jgi:hypothetical protein
MLTEEQGTYRLQKMYKEQTIFKHLNGCNREGKYKLFSIIVDSRSKTNRLESEEGFQVSIKNILLIIAATYQVVLNNLSWNYSH